MNENLCEILYDVTGEALEKLAFIFSQRDNGTASLGESDVLIVQVTFSGSDTGQIVAVAEKTTLEELTGNMMGMDGGDISWDDQKDALKETVNIICGNLLPKIYGTDSVFSIHAPTIITMSELNALCALRQPSAMVRLNMDEGSWVVYYFQNS